jgi:hypothetical protein
MTDDGWRRRIIGKAIFGEYTGDAGIIMHLQG